MSGHATENAHLTDGERDLLRDWWDEETTVGVESSFPIISRLLAQRAARAWDEGHRFTGFEPGRGENPYGATSLHDLDDVAAEFGVDLSAP